MVRDSRRWREINRVGMRWRGMDVKGKGEERDGEVWKEKGERSIGSEREGEG